MTPEQGVYLEKLVGGAVEAGGIRAELSSFGSARLEAFDLQLLQALLNAGRDGGPVLTVTAPGSHLNPGRWYPRRIAAAVNRLMDTTLEIGTIPEAGGPVSSALRLIQDATWLPGKPGGVEVRLDPALLDLHRRGTVRAWEGKLPDLSVKIQGETPPARNPGRGRSSR